MDGGAWWAVVHGVEKSWTRLSEFSFTFHFHALEKEMATHFQCSCLENPRDGRAWWAVVYRVAQSWTRLKRLSSSSSLGFLGFPCGSAGKESTCNAGDLGSIPGLVRSTEGGQGNSLQYSCLENPMDRGAWRAIEDRVTKSQTRLKRLSTHICPQRKLIRSVLPFPSR